MPPCREAKRRRPDKGVSRCRYGGKNMAAGGKRGARKLGGRKKKGAEPSGDGADGAAKVRDNNGDGKAASASRVAGKEWGECGNRRRPRVLFKIR